MNNLNSVLLEGNLCRDPELRYTPKGTPVCSLVVASNRSYKVESERQEEVSFIETTTWGKLATVCAEYLAKGRGVRVSAGSSRSAGRTRTAIPAPRC